MSGENLLCCRYYAVAIRHAPPLVVYADLIGDFEAHLAGGAGNDAEGGFVVARVEVFALGVHDLHDLLARDFADLRLVWFFGSGGDVGRFFQQDGRRWTFRDEGERLVFKNSDHDRENVAGLFLGGGVKFFAERHDVNAARAERGADGRRRVRLTSGNLEFDVSYNFFGHGIYTESTEFTKSGSEQNFLKSILIILLILSEKF